MPDNAPEFFDPAEDCPWRSPREILARCGYSPLPPSDLDDAIAFLKGGLVGRVKEVLVELIDDC